MIALIFLSVIAAVFVSVIALEGGEQALERRPRGLLTWITSGNWPAKIGGGLMVVGVGALLRYAAINFDVPASLKVGFGIAAAAALGFGSFLTAGDAQRRVVSLALGGAAFGVAYLTAYSAFALFGYLPTLQGLGLLALTAAGAGVFAVSRSAVSLAVLSMVGAFLAPAFAPEDPGVRVVYGYYIAISVLTLGMVALRGWRPLIHLSFLFTLAGSAFFAWTADYFTHANSAQMFPLLAILVAVHVAMPLVERRWARGAVVESLDTIYLLALPVVAALSALAIAPSRVELAVQLWWFAAIWLAPSAWLFTQRREGMASHAIIGLLMFSFGLGARFRDLPWELATLGVAVAALALAARRSPSARLHGFLAGVVLVLAAVHVLGALAPAANSTLFFNERFAERIVGALLLGVAALTLTRLRHTLDSLMLTIAIGWAAFAVGAEIVRLDLVSVWLVIHWLLALAGIGVYFAGHRLRASERRVVSLVLAIGLSGLLAQMNTTEDLAWVSAIIAGSALLAIALRPVGDDDNSHGRRPLAAIGAPIVVALWIGRVAHLTHANWQFPLAIAAAFALAVMLVGFRAEKRSARWFNEATDIFAASFAFVLAAAAVFDIERDVAAVLLELICVAGLMLTARWNDDRVHVGRWIIPATVIGVALVLQANLLRWLGPVGDLNALDVTKMNWPTLVSLLWASIGAALTIWARRIGSRVQWTAGAAFLVGAAIKLLLVDFGSLGQLANILAVIAAGGVFLLVGWLAPMPPAAKAPPAPPPRPVDAPPTPTNSATASQTHTPARDPSDSHASKPAPGRPHRDVFQWREASADAHRGNRSNKLAWTVAIAAILLITISQCGSRRARDFAWRDELRVIPQATVLPTPVADEPVESNSDRAASASTLAADAATTDVPPPTAQEPERASNDYGHELSDCRRWARRLPPNYQVHLLVAAGDLADERERRVIVDIPGHNIVLVLGTPEPVNWRVSASPATNIVGVWMPSTAEQRIEGIVDGTPILKSSEPSADCDFEADVFDEHWGADSVQRVLSREPASYTRLFSGWGRLQQPGGDRAAAAVSPARAAPRESANVSALSRDNPHRDDRLQPLVAEGKLRRATMSDYDEWRAAGGSPPRMTVMEDPFESETSGRFLFKMYVVQSAMTFPEGLYGAHAATFIVPRGVARPTGNPGHSQILDMNR
jgi:uncharacterized membrane protein